MDKKNKVTVEIVEPEKLSELFEERGWGDFFADFVPEHVDEKGKASFDAEVSFDVREGLRLKLNKKERKSNAERVEIDINKKGIDKNINIEDKNINKKEMNNDEIIDKDDDGRDM